VEAQTGAVGRMGLLATGTGGDGLPTNVKQLKLTNAATSGAADWTKVIRFFSIKVNGREISLGNPTITKTSATIPILPGDLMISEGATTEIAIDVGLKDLVTDGELLQIMVEAPNHGFNTAANGSAFCATMLQPLTSPSFPINVTANKLSWKKIPAVVVVNEIFDVEATAVDMFGNLYLN